MRMSWRADSMARVESGISQRQSVLRRFSFLNNLDDLHGNESTENG
jgi:hypothetical protein